MMALQGHIADFAVFGDDYPTPDGTAIRDYIHVTDLADAHVRALRHLEADGACGALNLGTGHGHSVRDVVAMVERVSGRRVEACAVPRRAGDPPVLVAAPGRATQLLGWQPTIPLAEGLKKTVAYFAQRIETTDNISAKV